MSNNKTIRVTPYRGMDQIGGVCTEIATDGARILFDFGAPLEAEGNQKPLSIEGVTKGAVDCDAVFLTHYHGDHVGEVPHIKAGIPIYMQKTARKVLQAQQEHMQCHGQVVWANSVKDLEYGVPVTINDLKVTPIESDHSAIDAVMFLVEGHGKRILLTGDYRMHGRNAGKLEKTFKEMPHIDLMITEGTNLTRDSKYNHDEKWVEEQFKQIISEYKYVFLLTSSSNVERIAEFLRNAGDGKYALVDKYQREIMDIVKADREDDLIPEKINYYSSNLDAKMENLGFRFVIRASEPFDSIVKYYFEKHSGETCLIYSMWKDYISRYPTVMRIVDYCKFEKDLKFVHVSGHITKEDLENVISTVAPDKLIIHHTHEAGRKGLKIPEGTKLLEPKDGKVVLI